jgi:hypothetical protein
LAESIGYKLDLTPETIGHLYFYNVAIGYWTHCGTVASEFWLLSVAVPRGFGKSHKTFARGLSKKMCKRRLLKVATEIL